MSGMTRQEWQRVKEIVNAALDVEPNEREAFLSRACVDDPSLRSQVEGLIRAHEEAGSFIEAPAYEAAAELVAAAPGASLSGRQLGRYNILSKLGAGGMAEVYLAHDSRLDRKVAIKLLAPDLVSDRLARHRLVREAKAAARLDHPNICSTYEVDEAEGIAFIAMQYVEGETLDRRIKREALTLDESINVAVQIASALAEAHEHGIIHRDIKPANVMMMKGGQVKVMDFGLAKIVKEPSLESDASTESLLTAPGTIVGTVAYMSPEQVRREELDRRSDIFSFGVVLYEILTGRQPFAAPSIGEVFTAILTLDPVPLARYSREAPAELERIVDKALRKDREQRYQSIKDMRLDLERLKETRSKQRSFGRVKRHKLSVALLLVMLMAALAAALYFGALGVRGQAIDSLAVLPFVNVSADPDTEYLSDGITDSLINSLSQLPRLKVMSHNSVFRYKGREGDAQSAGKQLGVRAVLTGRVVTRGDRLSIVTELVDAGDNSHLWGEQYSRKLTDIVAMQADISRDISEKLRLKLSGQDTQRLTKHYTENARAYDLYLKGRFYMNALSVEGNTKSLEYFRQAIEADPQYGPAYAGLAECYTQLGSYGTAPAIAPSEAYTKSKEAAKRAVALDDTLSEAHTSLALIATIFERDWDRAEREFKRAIALNPNYVNGHHWYSHYLIIMGRFAESLAESQRALALDPLDAGMNFHLGFHYYYARQPDPALAQLRKALEIDPNSGEAHCILGLVYGQKGLYDEAIIEFKRGAGLGGTSSSQGDLGYTYAVSSKTGEARKLLEQLLEESKHNSVSPYDIAMIYEGLGEREYEQGADAQGALYQDQAFEWLEKACQDRYNNIIYLKVDPRFDGLRSDPRFGVLLQRIGLDQRVE